MAFTPAAAERHQQWCGSISAGQTSPFGHSFLRVNPQRVRGSVTAASGLCGAVVELSVQQELLLSVADPLLTVKPM